MHSFGRILGTRAPGRAGILLPAVLLAFLALSAMSEQARATTLVPLRADAAASVPRIEPRTESAGEQRIAFELPALDVDSYTLGEDEYQTVLFGGCELFGEEGEPALPAFTRYLTVPEGKRVNVRVVSQDEEILSGYRILPMQADAIGERAEGARSSQADPRERLSLSPNAYARDEFLGGPAVELGEPAVLRGLRVVPLTWRPVSYNPARGELRVLRRIEIAVETSAGDPPLRSRASAVPSTPAYDRLFRALVLDYPRERSRDAGASNLGTWVIISRNSSSVLNELEPLVAWRERQGYRVVQATTAQTGTTPEAIKAWIQNAYDTWAEPPEYILIVGDYNGDFPIGSFTEYGSGYDGVGDHPYVQLDGNDNLPDAFIGRLSAQTTNQLRLIVHKIISYETQPYLSGRDWFSRACLVGDIESISALTCRQVQQWVKERLVRTGYTEIDTVWNSPYSAQMEEAVRRGVSYFGYRGYYGMSGWDVGDIYATRNGRGMMPFAVNLTCDTGTWYSGTSRSEAWLLAGTYPDSLKGGIGSIGTATTGTATRFNNCFYAGVAYGLFWEDGWHLGQAHARGKVEMIVNYGSILPATTTAYCYWNTLIGDPATEVWTARPRPLTVTYPAHVPLGANQVLVEVRDVEGLPVAGAWVHLFRDGVLANGARTDEAGTALVAIETASAGTVLVTVSGHDLYPHRGSLIVEQEPFFVGLDAQTLDDGSSFPARGNGDGLLNPGEQVGVSLTLRNFGTQAAHDVTLRASIDDPDVGLISAGPVPYGDIPAGASADADSGVIAFWLQPARPAGESVVLDLQVSAAEGTWQSRCEIAVDGPDLVARGYALAGCGDLLDPGESATLTVTFENAGTVTGAAPVQATLLSDAYAVVVTDPHGTLAGPFPPGASGTNAADPFGVASPADCIPGLLAPLRMALVFADGVRDTAEVLIPVGAAQPSDPTGPDAYGYVIYDPLDIDYPEAPTYNWIDIAGIGTLVGLTDYGPEEDDVVVVDLPFPFTYYGETFTRVSICSNGWLAMGSTYLTSYRNWYLPSAEGPANLIAVFWDDLYQHSGGKVYHWYDAVGHRYVIAWDDLYNNACYQARESCEAILYDPAYYPTTTGDGVMVFQYEKVNPVDTEQMYSTTGIENEDHTAGLTYCYFNRRPPSATWMLDNFALKITTGGPGAADANTFLETPPRLLLSGNEPNPFRAGTTIRFALDRMTPVVLRVFDVDGRVVTTLLRSALPAGEHAVAWPGLDASGRPAPSGVYFYRLEAGHDSASRRLLLLR